MQEHVHHTRALGLHNRLLHHLEDLFNKARVGLHTTYTYLSQNYITILTLTHQ
jgi:hypothetical protein